jgi:alpha-galactosidase
MMAAAVVSLALGLLYATGATALDNGVGKLPALGFNSQSTFRNARKIGLLT